MPATQDRQIIVKSSDKKWPTGGGNGKSVQLLQREPHGQYKRQKDIIVEDNHHYHWCFGDGGSCCLDLNKGLGGQSGALSPALPVRTQCRQAVITTLLMVTTDGGSRTSAVFKDLVYLCAAAQ